MQELDPALLPRAARVYCDSLDAVLAESGDIIKPLADGIITKEKLVGDLGDVILGKLPGRLNDEEILVFKSVGIGVQDLFTAKAIYDQAVAAGVGLKWC
jgi:ornithine cyclodeaminase